MKLGQDLGAHRDMNFRERQDFLYQQFDAGTSERRMCFFLNEMEDYLSKYNDLKENSQNLNVLELKDMKK